MMQAAANRGLEILVEASKNHDVSSGLIGAKILSFATAEQIATARAYCRVKNRHTDQQIEEAISKSRKNLS
jgi:hypothetical protein